MSVAPCDSVMTCVLLCLYNHVAVWCHVSCHVCIIMWQCSAMCPAVSVVVCYKCLYFAAFVLRGPPKKHEVCQELRC
jgi:hypothetical protein